MSSLLPSTAARIAAATLAACCLSRSAPAQSVMGRVDARADVFQVDAPLRGHIVGTLPGFRAELKKRGVTLGQTVVQFVIDTARLPEPGSVRVRSQSLPEFAETARAPLAVYRDVAAERRRIPTSGSAGEPWPPAPHVP